MWFLPLIMQAAQGQQQQRASEQANNAQAFSGGGDMLNQTEGGQDYGNAFERAMEMQRQGGLQWQR